VWLINRYQIDIWDGSVEEIGAYRANTNKLNREHAVEPWTYLQCPPQLQFVLETGRRKRYTE